MELKELLEKAFDAGYNTSVMYNCGDGNAYDNFESFYRNEIKQLTLTEVGSCLLTKDEIKQEANKYSNITGIICADENWVIDKHEAFIDGADFVINYKER